MTTMAKACFGIAAAAPKTSTKIIRMLLLLVECFAFFLVMSYSNH